MAGPSNTAKEMTDAKDATCLRAGFGCCSQVHDAARKQYAKVDSEAVYRVSDQGEFKGYLIDFVRRDDGTDWHTQYHFFGDGLTDTATDRAFFERLSFRKGLQHGCGK